MQSGRITSRSSSGGFRLAQPLITALEQRSKVGYFFLVPHSKSFPYSKPFPYSSHNLIQKANIMKRVTVGSNMFKRQYSVILAELQGVSMRRDEFQVEFKLNSIEFIFCFHQVSTEYNGQRMDEIYSEEYREFFGSVWCFNTQERISK